MHGRIIAYNERVEAICELIGNNEEKNVPSIFLLDIEKQKIIGNIYVQSIIHNALMIKRAENIRKFVMA